MAELLALISLGLATPGLLEILNKAGSAIQSRSSNVHHLREDLARYRQLGTSLARNQLYTQVELVLDADRYSLVPDALKAELKSCFDGIVVSLIAAEKELAAAEAHPNKSKFKLLLGQRVAFQSRVQELERQQNAFSVSANLVHMHRLIGPPSFLRTLKLLHEGPNNRGLRLLNHSDMNIGRTEWTGRKVIEVLVEHRPCTVGSEGEVQQAVASLTTKLQRAKLSQSVPQCLGYRNNPFSGGFDIVFELPAQVRQQSLADLLVSESRLALDHRVMLCRLLARAVSDVHGIQLVHKRIRPYAILLVGEYNRVKPSQAMYLTDWQLARIDDTDSRGISRWEGEDEWQCKIYQHPSRHGTSAGAGYTIEHDVYSLGVCMLEILLWQPFVVDADVSGASSEKVISEHFQACAIALGDEHGAPERHRGDTSKLTARPRVIRNVMLDLCNSELPACVGSKLTDIVRRCLCCLDKDEMVGQGHVSDIEELQSGLD